MTLDELPEDGKPVTWAYVGQVAVEAAGLLALGWVLLNVAALLELALKAAR